MNNNIHNKEITIDNQFQAKEEKKESKEHLKTKKIKADKNMNSIDSYKNPYIINRPNGTIYKKQKAIKKIPMQKAITKGKGKLDVKVINEIKKEEKKNDAINNDIIYNRHEEKIN